MDPEPLAEMADSREGAGNTQNEHDGAPESKGVLKKPQNDGAHQGMQEPPANALNGPRWNNLSNEINSIVLYYNPKHKINSHVSI